MLMVLLGAFVVAGSAAEERVALVVGNSNYQHFSLLATPAEEAEELAARLEELGFEVDLRLDADQETMILALDALQRRLANGGTAFVHYGGHGVQADGRNYLIPVDADIPDERFLRTRAVDLEEVMMALEVSGSDTNIVVLDACRDNPIPSMARSGTRGLAVVQRKPANSLIVYSAQEGSVARDGLFTPALLEHIGKQISFIEVLHLVQRDVEEASSHSQRPGAYVELREPIYLAGRGGARPTAQASVRTGAEDSATPSRSEAPAGFVRIESGWFDFSLHTSERGGTEYPYNFARDARAPVDTWLRSYFLAANEVTFREYDAFCDATGWMPPDDHDWGRGDLPVIHVSFLDAVAYCNWRSEQEGLTPCFSFEDDIVSCDFTADGYRLPTVAEWEFAARGRTQSIGEFLADVPYGNIRDQAFETRYPDAWGEVPVPGYDDGHPHTAPVGRFMPNPLGVFDLDGNVSELCWDYRDTPYEVYAEQQTDPRGAPISEPWQNETRSIRGPNWAGELSSFGFNGDPENDTVQIHWELTMYHADKRTIPWVGFRLARSVAE